MLNTAGLLRSLEVAPDPERLAATGFRELDELTGGLSAGQVWLVCGGPGQGKTTLAVQWALGVARRAHPVQLVCPREPGRWLASRLLSNLARLPLVDLSSGRVDAADRRYVKAREALGTLPVYAFTQDGRVFTPEVDPYEREPSPRAVLIDDVDLVSGMTPARAAAYAASGMLVVVTLPRERVLADPHDESRVLPEWARVSDAILEVRHRGLPPSDGAAAWEGDPRYLTTRPGEADLLMHRHRWGPTRDLTLGFQGHYARFVDLRV
jgi:replicative DNA helicase